MFNPKCQIHKLLGKKKKVTRSQVQKRKNKNKLFLMLSSNSVQLLAKGCECKMFTWTQRKTG